MDEDTRDATSSIQVEMHLMNHVVHEGKVQNRSHHTVLKIDVFNKNQEV